MNWTALREIPPGEHGKNRSTCESCSLYIWSEGGYKIPNRKGYFCTILCVECELFGNGNCRWCGEKLKKGAHKFCCESHRKQSNETKFGDGTRFLNYLARYHPATYRELTAKGCENCGDPLNGKREGSRFCNDRCRKRFSATSPTLAISGNNAETPQRNQSVTDHENKSGVAALVA